LFISLAAHFDLERPSHQALERGPVTRRRPQFELRITTRPNLQQGILAAIMELDVRNQLRMAAVEAFRETHHRCKRPDRSPAFLIQPRIFVVPLAGFGAPMIPRDERHGIDLVGLEPPQITILDQIGRMFVMSFV
jgi:hypothetical protein